MSYENPIPPVPSRADEIFMIQKSKKSLERVSYLKPLVNEANRIQVFEYKKKFNSYRFIWWRNFFRGLVVMSVPALFLATSFRKGQYGIPRYRVSKFYDAFEFPHYQSPRLVLILKFGTPTWVIGAYFYAQYMTSDDDLFDEYYDQYNKVKLPYQLNFKKQYTIVIYKKQLLNILIKSNQLFGSKIIQQ